jgi:jasmonate ZIM domain-containing protein
VPPTQQQHQQQQQQQHVLNGARAVPGSSPFSPNNQTYKVQSSPNLPNGVAAGGPFKQPPFAVNNAGIAASRVGVYAR